MRGHDLQGKDLTNADFTGALLAGTLFHGALTLKGANFTGVVLGCGTDFSSCDLSEATIDFASLLKIAGAMKAPVLLKGATVPFAAVGLTWRDLDLTDATVTGLPHDLSGLSATACILTRFNFSGHSLRNAHFSATDLRYADFSGAALDHAVFAPEDGVSTDLSHARFGSAAAAGAVFNAATLSDADFTAADLKGAHFLNARMDGAIFDKTDLTSCAFSSPPSWSSDPARPTRFRSASIRFETLQKLWSCLDLTDTTVVGLDATVDLSWLEARHAILTGRVLTGFKLNNCDLSGAVLDASDFAKASMIGAQLLGVQGAGTKFKGTALLGASFNPIITDGGKQATALQGACFAFADLTGAQFIGADFRPAPDENGKRTGPGADFNAVRAQGATFTKALLQKASFTGAASLNGAMFAGADLSDADLTGAQLGDSTLCFALMPTEDDYNTLSGALQGKDATVASRILQARGLTPPASALLQPVDKQTWTLGTYTFEERVSATATSLQVWQAATAASLSGAYMPGALFTNANLSGVDASHAQVWVTRSRNQFDHAVMDRITLASAILGSDRPIVLANASLKSAVFTDAFLVNVDFQSATLTDARFDRAQVQGADFRSAMLDGAQFTDAAVSVALTTDIAGVWLFNVPSDAATDVQAELTIAAAKSFLLVSQCDTQATYNATVSDLDKADNKRLAPMFAKHKVTLDATATIVKVQADFPRKGTELWQVTNPAGKPAFAIWAVDEIGEIRVRPPLAALKAVLDTGYQITLHDLAEIQVPTTLTEPASSWIVDNDSNNPQNLTKGYVQFLVTTRPDKVMSVYGFQVHAAHGDTNEQMFVVQLAPTRLSSGHTAGSQPAFSPDTVCPNGVRFDDNIKDGTAWMDILHAATIPPQPPSCVPSAIAPCSERIPTSLNRYLTSPRFLPPV